jgi:hypothetical protein
LTSFSPELDLSLIDNLLHRVTDYLPCRMINGEQGEPYLERYYVASLGWIGLKGWHAYLHRFVDSDPDRGLHDHPWGLAMSLVLTGGYDEVRFAAGSAKAGQGRTITRRIRPGRINRLRGEDYHRVVLQGGRPAWTLFMHGPRVKGWGFLRNGDYRAMARSADEFRHRDWWKQAPCGRAARAQQCPATAPSWIGNSAMNPDHAGQTGAEP